ncbi:hypothetical protein ACKW6Q_17885 [Chryseobacterium kwangjuense]|uniref:PH domain-containing protein n=1 Tax=Chryseobacterium kwangjuense TaxID=267125 RepID=A0ABW9K692_9FLAO
MEQIVHDEIFSAPQWVKIICYIFSPAIFGMGVVMLIVKDIPFEVRIISPLLFLIAVSMLIYTRLRLRVSDGGISFTGGISRHHFKWEDITKVDMEITRKYQTPKVILHYADRTLVLDCGFYLKKNFPRILSLLEIKLRPELFTGKYLDIRRQII